MKMNCCFVTTALAFSVVMFIPVTWPFLTMFGFGLAGLVGLVGAILMALIQVLLVIGGYLLALLLPCFCCFVTTALAQLLPVLAFSVVIMLIPATWILMPFLSIFGFGLAGPVGGSIAAWLQSYFWGAAVGGGSWFAFLQAAGMGVIPMWAGLLIKVPLAIGGGLLALLLPFFG